jgi:hypothetical protein
VRDARCCAQQPVRRPRLDALDEISIGGIRHHEAERTSVLQATTAMSFRSFQRRPQDFSIEGRAVLGRVVAMFRFVHAPVLLLTVVFL